MVTESGVDSETPLTALVDTLTGAQSHLLRSLVAQLSSLRAGARECSFRSRVRLPKMDHEVE